LGLGGTVNSGTIGQIPYYAAAGDTLTATSTLFIDTNSYVGIGTSTPQAKFSIQGDSGEIIFQVASSTGAPVLQVAANGYVGIGSTSVPQYDLDVHGRVNSTMGYLTAGADYAEYFYTEDVDLAPGETVCVDVTNENAVKRCDRQADSNVMGVVSGNPSIVGNYQEEYRDNDSYVIVAMLGQISAKVSTENGEIRPGDSLTPGIEPGYIVRAGAGDPTVGIALEALSNEIQDTNKLEDTNLNDQTDVNVEIGEIKVLISRRNKSLTVEMVESTVTDRIASMEIEDEVAIMLSQAIEDYNIASATEPIIEEQIAMFDEALTVEFDNVNNELLIVVNELDSVIARVNTLEDYMDGISNRLSLVEDSLVVGNASSTDASSSVEIIDLDAVVQIVTATSSKKTAFVVNQSGDSDVADFRAHNVSIVNIADAGLVSVVGEMSIDGRLMVCSGAGCGANLDEAVDETMGDVGVEGKVVAGAFESYCDDNYVWVPGSAKYGTMPGFCVEADEHKFSTQASSSVDISRTNITQGEAQLACYDKGMGYHLITENEWLTLAESILRNVDNDIDPVSDGLQLATAGIVSASTTIALTTELDATAFKLENGAEIYNLFGGVAEWTDYILPGSALLEPQTPFWQEYFTISDYKGLNINPPYYYSSEMGIGKIKTGLVSSSTPVLRGFVRGESALFDLDLTHSPVGATSTVGFRCAR
ncbi:MAG: hypothetical protein U9Q85_04100, partial [Patescibacteria group bacterium]|nr:hypothetical protein [Patescibacteria group bacterium]